METLGLILPGLRRAEGVRTTRPTFPTRRFIRPIINIAHRMSGLDLAAYHGRNDGEDEDDVNQLSGIEGDSYWDTSDDGSDWEEIGPQESSPGIDEGDSSGEGGEQDNDGGVRMRLQRHEGATKLSIQERGSNSDDDWELISQIQGISEEQHVAETTSEPSISRGACERQPAFGPKRESRKIRVEQCEK